MFLYLLAALSLAPTTRAADNADAPDNAAMDAALGAALFKRIWVPAPASTKAADGLGPLYNQRSCFGCHPDGGGDGRTLRVSGPEGGPHPRYGVQIQDRAVHGIPAEAQLRIAPPARPGAAPTVRLADLAYGPIDEAFLGLRRAPMLFGVGLLERVPEAVILAQAGVNGGTPGRSRDGRLGRFGWRADAADLPEQIAAAASTDIGLSSPLRPDPYGDCQPAQSACRAAPIGTGFELTAEGIAVIAAYLRALPPPSPRGGDVPAGRAAFTEFGCAACHRPDLFTAARAVDPGFPEAPEPFTDLLTHDLGPGVADHDAAGRTNSGTFRTAPLWGLSQRRNGPLLHDGRAATLDAAIRAHGGEAAPARARYDAAPKAQRSALLDFLSRL